MRTRVAAAAFVAAAVAFVTGFPAGGPTMAAATGACVPAPILRGAPPPWTSSAWADSPGFRLPYSVASGRSAAAFFWVTLRAGSPTNPANKVLWVMRYPRRGSPLRISARDGAKPALTVRSSWPADSSPGEIYPSYLNLPKPGCWRLTLRWSSHVAHLNVSVVRAKRPSS